MKLGLENKRQTAILGGLFLVLGYALYSNVLSGPSQPASAPAPAAAPAQPSALAPEETPAAAPRPSASRDTGGDFHPVFRPRRPEDRIDPTKVDPTLHMELLDKLQNEASDTAGRNLFQFGAPPPPPPTPAQLAQLKKPEPIVTPHPVTPAAPPPPPQAALPPPIPLKYFGLSTARSSGRKVAFFLDGENILMGSEGDMLQKRYRVVRINISSVVLEDTQQKRSETVPLVIEPNG
ncbi:MAG TPA: hypothetical protein VMU19_11895 [Bryobacteraceae bacterium]|nr:hypothetical protein [Bryobacteraceae bacterium]